MEINDQAQYYTSDSHYNTHELFRFFNIWYDRLALAVHIFVKCEFIKVSAKMNLRYSATFPKNYNGFI